MNSAAYRKGVHSLPQSSMGGGDGMGGCSGQNNSGCCGMDGNGISKDGRGSRFSRRGSTTISQTEQSSTNRGKFKSLDIKSIAINKYTEFH